MEHWEKLFWNWPTSTKKYTQEDWQLIISSMVESFNQRYQFNLTPLEPYGIYPEINDYVIDRPCTDGRLMDVVLTPICPLVYYALHSINTYNTETENHIYADITVFLFFGKTRLLSEKLDAESFRDQDAGEYMRFMLTKNESLSERWQHMGWEFGFPSEWDNLKLPDPAVEFIKSRIPSHYQGFC